MDKFINDLMKMPENPSLSDRLWFGLEVALIGIAIVFSVLILLWIILELFGYISNKLIKNKNLDELNAGDGVPDVPTDIKNTSDIIEIINENDEEDELIAVITAAVSAVLDKPVSGFRVVSFKQRTGWKQI